MASSKTLSNPPDAAAIQARIITHMNADHTDSLSLFLQHYNSLPAAQAATAKISSIALDHMILSSPHGRSYVPISPPMRSWYEARHRMVDMHEAALTGLDLSSVKITTYKPPNTPLQILVISLTGVSFLSFSSPAILAHLRPFWSLGGFAPWLYDLADALQPYVIVFMVVVHGLEAGWMARTRLRRYRVSGAVWWAWVGSTFLEGFGAFERIDGMVKKKEKEMMKKEEGNGSLKH